MLTSTSLRYVTENYRLEETYENNLIIKLVLVSKLNNRSITFMQYCFAKITKQLGKFEHFHILFKSHTHTCVFIMYS